MKNAQPLKLFDYFYKKKKNVISLNYFVDANGNKIQSNAII